MGTHIKRVREVRPRRSGPRKRLYSDVEAGFRVRFVKYRSGAKARGIEWKLSRDEAKLLFVSSCFYCGVNPLKSYNRRGPTTDTGYGDLFHSNGIDRLNPKKGYELGNVVPACARCNFGKLTDTYEQFIAWIYAVYTHVSAKDQYFDSIQETVCDPI